MFLCIELADKLYGGFQLLDLIIPELKSHTSCYDSMPLIGWEQIL